ncbi:hypothetical protein COCSUDRAFT_33964 [Coccomyxa subellipsoidea C-169]|uniref:Uncharacterized protein n=1 Tax=Coccomyxa subellipsoidea (strain C-169) TaxID=574566 RepID=I0YPT5_COCSC|nr:hypothetical protein COCSUDRAFT_33964 [Coccomyxa subellipsoidea C-169]EIE20404.1 hypothetical protein COCSUDRAFT_33964 [Coccomyxa subellipsoidea C-169]|eukprot:XP_005644948.1 hypothetical protein COCSUDRAFT_33964 [Coccomyxa subellipsoidea C-169]
MPFVKVPGAPTSKAMQDEIIHHQRQEIEYMREQLHIQNEELRRIQRQTGTSAQHVLDLRERLNFQRFKYELLVDMWAMRVLDNEELAHEHSGTL